MRSVLEIRKRKPRKKKPYSANTTCKNRPAVTNRQRQLRRKERFRDVSQYLDFVRGYSLDHINADLTIVSATAIMASAYVSLPGLDERYQEEHMQQQQQLTNATSISDSSTHFEIDVNACVLLHKAITASNQEHPTQPCDPAQRNWFILHGEAAEAKRAALHPDLVQFLENIDSITDDTAASTLKSCPQICNPSTMFGEDNLIPRNAFANGHCILLYHATNESGGQAGLALRLEDNACCWRNSLHDQPSVHCSLQDTLLGYVERKGETGKMELQFRPKQAGVEQELMGAAVVEIRST